MAYGQVCWGSSRPQPGTRSDYVIILRFDSYHHLQQWMNSEVRKHWIEGAEPLTQKVENVQILTGLDYLVSLPGQTPLKPPPRYKTAILVWIGVYFCSTLLGVVVMPHLMVFLFMLRQAIMVAITVGLLTYLVMHFLTKIFAKWLHS